MHSDVRQRLVALLAGRQDAAAWLYDTFAPRLYRRLKGRYGHPRGLDPDDLLQDAYVFYFQHDGRVLQRFLGEVPPAEQSEARLESYLWDLACGLASNRRRSAASRATRPLEAEELPPVVPLAERRVIERDTLGRLEDCLRRSSHRVFLYFTLRYRDGLTPEEITAACGWSRKATYKLRQALDAAIESCAETLALVPR